MALLLLSEIGITDIRGKIAGTQFTRTRSGNQGISPTTPRQPFSSYQQTAQNHFQQVIHYWTGLTEIQRIAWDEAAELPAWQRLNRIGVAYQPTGQSLFIQLNLSVFKQSFPIIDPPAYPDFPAIALTGLDAVATEFLIAYFDDNNIPADFEIFLYTTRQLSPGRMSTNQREYFFNVNKDRESFSGTIEFLFDYEFKWGTLIVGRKIFVEGFLVHIPSGARIGIGNVSAIINTP